MMTLFFALWASLLTLGLIYSLLPWAKQCGWVDSPRGIKQHVGDVPWIGGCVLWVVFFVLNVALGWQSPMHTWWLLGGWLFLFLGCWDDLHHVSAHYRLGIQFLLAGVLYFHFPPWVWPLAPLASHELLMRLIESLFFLFAAGAVINGMNMLDGQDGLLAGVALTQWFWCVLLLGYRAPLAESILLLMGALLGFLILNFPWWGRSSARVFIGNSGSYVLGWSSVCFAAYVIVGGHQGVWRDSLAVLWVVYLPTLDCLVAVVRRAASAAPLFHGDRGHVHHLLQRLGLSAGPSTCLLSLFSFVTGGVGYLVVHAGLSLVAFFLLYAATFFALGGWMWWLDRKLM
jgi:UDP-GlcNAc:undecaprenyl-phosphate GlcNAc-1-phosphate transferase